MITQVRLRSPPAAETSTRVGATLAPRVALGAPIRRANPTVALSRARTVTCLVAVSMQYKLVNLIPLIADNWDWQLKAACRGMDVDLFYEAASVRGPAKRARVAHAKAICATCSVTRQCLDQALALGETAGIWGGLTTEERNDLHGPHTTI